MANILRNACTVVILTSTITSFCPAAAPFRIQVVDEATSRGIPLVILETGLSTRLVTDSNGLVAIDDPVAMDHDLFVKPISDGYSYRASGLAMGGAVLKIKPDSSATLVMQRDMIAERLYRITGSGIYRETVAVGEKAPIEHPMLNYNVVGQDSALCSIFNGRLFWIWGDTGRMGHPLSSNFRATGAFSDLPTSGGLAASAGINLNYIVKDDFVKPMMPMRGENGGQVYWLSALMTVADSGGRDHLIAWWNRIENTNMVTKQRGISEFDPASQEFKYLVDYPTTATLQPGGHAIRVKDANGRDYMLITGSGPVRVPATYEAAIDITQYEALTCLDNDGEFTTATARVHRNSEGKVVYAWRKGVAPTGAAEQRALLQAGLLKENECIFRPVDANSGKTFLPHGCTIAYSKARSKYIMLTSEIMGTSMLGELWYLEADRPEGPWINAVKVLTHKKYSFYNPLQHPELVAGTPDENRYLYFEGTYTKTFSTEETPTPYYDYNQIMYRLDLNDPRLKLDKSSTGSVALIPDASGATVEH